MASARGGATALTSMVIVARLTSVTLEGVTEPFQEAVPRVGGVGFGEVFGAVAHEAVPGLGVHNGVGVVGRHLLDVLCGDPNVLPPEEQQGRTVGRPQLVGDRAAVEADGGV